MKKFLFALVMVKALALSGCTDKDRVVSGPGPAVSVSDKGWTFESTPIFADEFDYTGRPNSAKWSYDVGGGGFGNNELQYYTGGANANVADGLLTIEARRENFENSRYTSTRMVTRNKADFTYGRYEARIKLPTGRGLWPAFWMLPTDAAYGVWPKSGEIDIMEQVGYEPTKIHQSVHTDAYNHKIGTQKTASTTVPTATSDFHLYRVDWTPYAVRGYVDNVKVFEFVNAGGSSRWPFDKRFHMILNIAVGGDWGGANGVDDTIFPAQMQVDYVRVYKMIEQ